MSRVSFLFSLFFVADHLFLFLLSGRSGTSLGQKTILFSRTGANAALYPGLAPTKVFFVERGSFTFPRIILHLFELR